MWTKDGPKVVEYNVRLGDPETQALVCADNADWVQIVSRTLKLGSKDFPEPKRFFAKSIVLASAGYPYGDKTEIAAEVSPEFFSPTSSNSQIFAASTSKAQDQKKIRLGSGRVVNLAVWGQNFAECDENISKRN